MKRQFRQQRGFVTNELPIVFITTCVVCFILVSAAAGSLPWYWRVLDSIGLAVVGFACLFTVASVIEALRERRKERAKGQQRRTSPPDESQAP